MNKEEKMPYLIENKEMKEKIKKLRELLKDYKYTKVDDYHKIIEFYKMLEEILGDKEQPKVIVNEDMGIKSSEISKQFNDIWEYGDNDE